MDESNFALLAQRFGMRKRQVSLAKAGRVSTVIFLALSFCIQSEVKLLAHAVWNDALPVSD